MARFNSIEPSVRQLDLESRSLQQSFEEHRTEANQDDIHKLREIGERLQSLADSLQMACALTA